MNEETSQPLSIEQLASISDEALDNVYHYGRSKPSNTFGWQANLKSAEYAKKIIESGETDIEKIADAIHKGWNETAKKFVENPDQFDDTEKLKASGKLQAKLEQRKKLMNIEYAQLPEDEKEKDRIVAVALLDAIDGEEELSENNVGDIMLEDLLDEKKKKKKKKKKKRDACYYKVKARYKVWPSAYASGALVKCRKKGSKNWGTKSEGVEEINEKWSEKYKRSINCNNPKGFSQRAHCQGRKKTEEEIMKEEQLKNTIREMIMDELKCWDGYKRVPGKSAGEKGSCTKMEEQSSAQDESMEECWECYQTGMNETTGEIMEECYRTTRWYMVPESDEHTCEGDQFYEVYGDINDDAPLTEAEYRGRKVKLGKPMRGDVKKFKVFVRKPNGKVVKVNFGDKKMRIKKSNPKRRKSFRARHKCKTPGPRWKARYWSCRKW